MSDLKSIFLNSPAEKLESIIAPFIEEQFPLFARSDYRKLVLFIKAYYEWMDSEGKPSYVVGKLDTVFDVDKNAEEFFSHFKSLYLDSFPEVFTIDELGRTPNKKTLLKKIRDFYGNKGTESSYKFLFKVLYDSDVEFYYPKTDIIKASDGQWIEELSVKVTRGDREADHYLLVGGTAVQYVSLGVPSGYATIERVYKYYQDGVPITELFLKDLVGNFSPNKSITLIPPSAITIQPIEEVTFSVLGEFFVTTKGQNYKIGDVVYISGGDGVGFSARVEQTGIGGGVTRIRIENSGINFFSSVTGVVVSESGVNATSTILFTPTAVTRYPGYYKGDRGKVSSLGKMYDGDYYQEYSYELRSSISIDRYFSVLKKLVHPAGMKMWGSILLNADADASASGSSQIERVSIPVIGNYTPYTLGTTTDLRANGITVGTWFVNFGGVTYGTTGDLYPIGYNPYIGSTAELGPNGKTAPLGTSFTNGGSTVADLGYTYSFVLERGRTAHNPLGGPLGGLTAWSGSKESALQPVAVNKSPFDISGLTLWLKPENIGVCGASMITGRCMDIWRDASESQNHALPPKWSMWTTNPSYTGITVDKLRPTLVVADRGIQGRTGIQFNGGVIYGPNTVWFQAGVCGGHTAGTTLGALSSEIPFQPGGTGEKILSGQFFTLSKGLTLTKDMTVFIAFRAGTTSAGYTASHYGLGFVSSDRSFHQFSPATMYYPLMSTSGGNLVTVAGVSLWSDHITGTGVNPVENANVTDPNGNTTASSVTFNSGSGTSVSDFSLKLLSISSTAGVVTGNKYTFSVWLKGTVGGEKILIRHVAQGNYTVCTLTTRWQRFVITETASTNGGNTQIGIRQGLSGIGTINASATVHIWGPQLELGTVSTLLTSVSGGETDHALYHRSYSNIDSVAANRIPPNNSLYYYINGSGALLYPPDTGLVGLRTNVGSTLSARIAFNPFTNTVSGVSLEHIALGEWLRETDGRIRSFYSGNESRNLSSDTARRIATPGSPGGSSVFNLPAAEIAYNTNPISLSRFGSYCLPLLDSGVGITAASWVTNALNNVSYSFSGVIYEVIVYDRVLNETERHIVSSYLSRKYRLDRVLPASYAGSAPSGDLYGITTGFWSISKHPNTIGSTRVLSGVSFGSVTIEDFINLYGVLYKSEGTRLADGTVLTEDTYERLGG